MVALNRVPIVMLIWAAVMLARQTASTMTVEMFDAMAVEDQHDYVALLVKQAREVLVQQDRKDLAAKLDDLFHTRRGHQSSGELQFEEQLAISRDFFAQQNPKDLRFKPLPGEIESALIVTFQKNGIPMSGALFKALTQAWTAKPYWPKRPLRTARDSA
jgi:hypothetical protein